jgi:TPP-dependent pyruvate/acetoin dehydrogenase alpha subunit
MNIRQVLREDGTVVGQIPLGLTEDDFRCIFRLLLLTRALDEHILSLAPQGRISAHASSRGHEGAQVGSGYGLNQDDWVFPSPHRELGVHLAKGFEFRFQMLGRDSDPTHGRQMPNHFGSRKLSIVPPSTAVATRIPDAAGVGWAARQVKKSTVAVSYFGDGATSMSEFHVGLNFAGVFKNQAVFFCINNFWAISTPLERQTAGHSIAERAAAYGFPGVLVDGHDVLAVYQVTQQALARAREGADPTLIEARVTRLCAHTSFDDERRYRNPAELEEGERKSRSDVFLQNQGVWTDAWEQESSHSIRALVLEETSRAESSPAPAPETLLDP